MYTVTKWQQEILGYMVNVLKNVSLKERSWHTLSLYNSLKK